MGWGVGRTWLAAKCDCVSGFLVAGLAKKKGCNQWNHLVKTPGALGARKTKLMMMVKLLSAASRLDGDEKRGEGGAPHLG